MNGAAARFLRIAASSAGLVILGFVLTGHANKPVPHGMSLPTDWSHQHVIFTRPRSAEMARRFGDDPRYLQQMYRQDQVLKLAAPVADARLFSLSPLRTASEIKKSKGLWSQNLGVLSGNGLGAQNYPAKYTFETTVANCAGVGTPDYVVYSTGIAGSGTQASIVAYDNLYTGCTGIVPTVFWAYNTGGQVLTSPVLSENGDQVAFVETSGEDGILVMLKWAAGGTVGSPATIALATPASYPTCHAPCMTQVHLGTGGVTPTPTDDTTSSIFYDYSSDTGWVGGAGGWLHKITGVFHGVPTEVNNGTFPVQVNSGATFLSSPVYDYVFGAVFVGDSSGFLNRVDPNLGTVTQSHQVDFGTGLVEGPVIDAFDGLVYVFSSSDGTTGCNAGTSPCSAVFQFDADFVADAVGNKTTVGQSSATPNPLYLGAFDTAYIKSEGPPTGNLYVCGNTGANPVLYQIPMVNGVMPAAGNVITQLAPVTSTAGCSPVSDIQNQGLPGGTQERLFVSPQNNGRPAVCAADTGCLTSLLDTPWRPGVGWGQGQELLSSNLRIMVAISSGGKSGDTEPTWTNTQAGTTITDGTVTWLDQGHVTAVQPAQWMANHAYNLHQRILDTNNRIEVVTTAGTSSGTEPDWSPDKNAGDTTTDGTVTWTNAGDNPAAALPVTGGTTGVILDNTANEGSQVYFGTLANQGTDSGVITGTACPSGAACAVQASQTALQ